MIRRLLITLLLVASVFNGNGVVAQSRSIDRITLSSTQPLYYCHTYEALKEVVAAWATSEERMLRLALNRLSQTPHPQHGTAMCGRLLDQNGNVALLDELQNLTIIESELYERGIRPSIAAVFHWSDAYGLDYFVFLIGGDRSTMRYGWFDPFRFLLGDWP